MIFRHLALFSLLLLVGCAAQGSPELSRTEQCRVQMESARDDLAREKYFPARETLNRILSECSGTGFLEEGQFLIAESYFAEEAWIEARGEYSSFVRYYTSSPYAETAAYKKAYSALMMPFVLGRDQTFTDRAIEDFNAFLTDFPSSSKTDSALIHLETLRERKAETAFSIGRLYFRMKEYQAAAISLKDFLKEFPVSSRTAEGREMLLASYVQIKQFAQAEQWLAAFASDPDRPYPTDQVERHRKAIEKGKRDLISKRQKEALLTRELVANEE